eukprot:4000416-Pleurochrysis_carterae.AAC.1
MMYSPLDHMLPRTARCVRSARPRLQFLPLSSPFCASPAPLLTRRRPSNASPHARRPPPSDGVTRETN